MHTLEGKKVFIIEDNPVFLNLLWTCMLKSGAQIESNVLGYDILDHLLESIPVDIILLDLNLRKGINGYDVFFKIRSHDALKHIPVVLVTASDWETEIPRAKACGLDGFIAKPINLVNFPSTVMRAIQGEKIWDV